MAKTKKSWGLRNSETCKPRYSDVHNAACRQMLRHGWDIADTQDASTTFRSPNSPRVFVRVLSPWSNAYGDAGGPGGKYQVLKAKEPSAEELEKSRKDVIAREAMRKYQDARWKLAIRERLGSSGIDKKALEAAMAEAIEVCREHDVCPMGDYRGDADHGRFADFQA